MYSSAKAADTPKDKPLTIVADLPIPKAAAFTDWEGCARNGTCTKPELLLTNDVFCAVQGSCTPCVGLDLKAATACEKTGFRHPIHCNVTTDASAQLPTEERYRAIIWLCGDTCPCGNTCT
ncbi:hypothetical protein SARC_06618 [Sphaeroforma arctica JP610]|uniref:Uncharacterized protein n=1 Tax=Sphaeroforma arctica JP610 TaxID=667725 RepID=A0A0L0FWV4_9EUKA|nr:hypothetical protein SARC_06618 [Sphaeroforma arctica JP610]KNC81041.1 hypothetical protein SARC_06618 [Sphaeroforma arctica JP610]|eukprot:XP_014154943.1 hypothetical protein SARC_06618 [Sphaeroforma arctica JP610]